jgi:DNA (cytosine-5)-methyltransferase 1
MAGRKRKLSEFMRVGEAAEFLGVSSTTLRNWDRAGVLRPARHPVNGYRLYLRRDLERLLMKANGPRRAVKARRRGG